MHGTVEWLPGQPLGNDRQSWSDELLGDLPNIYCYAANNPSESILAKRRGYGTLVSYNVPPYGRAGLYLELSNLKDLVNEYRSLSSEDHELRNTIWTSCQRCGIDNDVPLYIRDSSEVELVDTPELPLELKDEDFKKWLFTLSDYLVELQDRLFSSGLHTLGSQPSDAELQSYLQAYFGESLSKNDCQRAVDSLKEEYHEIRWWEKIQNFLQEKLGWEESIQEVDNSKENNYKEAKNIVSLLSRNTEELESLVCALDGGYVKPAPGGDLLRDGTAVLPTGRNIHALDPYRLVFFIFFVICTMIHSTLTYFISSGCHQLELGQKVRELPKRQLGNIELLMMVNILKRLQ